MALSSRGAKTSKKRLNLELSQESYEMLSELAEAHDKNMADVLRTGLALYSIAHEEKRKGMSIGIIQDDKVIKEILIV
jgi:hypothetical protein